MERIYYKRPYAIKTQPKTRNALEDGHLVPKVCLYRIGELASDQQHHDPLSDLCSAPLWCQDSCYGSALTNQTDFQPHFPEKIEFLGFGEGGATILKHKNLSKLTSDVVQLSL